MLVRIKAVLVSSGLKGQVSPCSSVCVAIVCLTFFSLTSNLSGVCTCQSMSIPPKVLSMLQNNWLLYFQEMQQEQSWKLSCLRSSSSSESSLITQPLKQERCFSPNSLLMLLMFSLCDCAASLKEYKAGVLMSLKSPYTVPMALLNTTVGSTTVIMPLILLQMSMSLRTTGLLLDSQRKSVQSSARLLNLVKYVFQSYLEAMVSTSRQSASWVSFQTGTCNRCSWPTRLWNAKEQESPDITAINGLTQLLVQYAETVNKKEGIFVNQIRTQNDQGYQQIRPIPLVLLAYCQGKYTGGDLFVFLMGSFSILHKVTKLVHQQQTMMQAPNLPELLITRRRHSLTDSNPKKVGGMFSLNLGQNRGPFIDSQLTASKDTTASLFSTRSTSFISTTRSSLSSYRYDREHQQHHIREVTKKKIQCSMLPQVSEQLVSDSIDSFGTVSAAMNSSIQLAARVMNEVTQDVNSIRRELNQLGNFVGAHLQTIAQFGLWNLKQLKHMIVESTHQSEGMVVAFERDLKETTDGLGIIGLHAQTISETVRQLEKQYNGPI